MWAQKLPEGPTLQEMWSVALDAATAATAGADAEQSEATNEDEDEGLSPEDVSAIFSGCPTCAAVRQRCEACLEGLAELEEEDDDGLIILVDEQDIEH